MSKILVLSATFVEHEQTFLYDNEIHIIGIGKVNAAVQTARLINLYKPDVVVNFGSCGSVKHFPIGEVLRVGKVINDIDVMNISNDSDIILQGKGDITCCTTDHFYDKSRKHQSKTFYTREDDIDIVDMELYSIASTCRSLGVLCYGFKWVSDYGDLDQWKENAAKGYEEFKHIFKDLFL